MGAGVAARPNATEREFIDGVIARNRGRPGALLTVLERVQQHHPQNYLPEATLEYVATRMRVPAARVYSVATFYSLFNLQPQGKHTVCICRGTACHTRGSRNLLSSAQRDLGLGMEEDGGADKVALTTPDAKFTVRTVACFGQCALAPVVEIDHRICSRVNERTLQRELRALERERG